YSCFYLSYIYLFFFFFFQAEDGIRDLTVTGVQTCALPISQKIAASWRTLRVAGFPFAFRVELSDAALRDEAINPPADIRMPLLSASAHPWSFGVWHLAAPRGLSAVAGPEGKPVATVSARAVEGAV